MKDPLDNKNNSGDSASSSCECVEDRIHELMDQRRPLLSDVMVRKHIAECDECAELIIDFGALNESLSQIPLETLHRLSGLQLGDEVEDEVRSGSRQLHPVSFVASIACLLLVMLTSGIWFSGQPDNVVTVNQRDVEDRNYVSVEAQAPVEHVKEPALGMQQLVFVPTVHKTSSPSEFIHAVSFEQLSGGVEPFHEYIEMTADLPGIRPVSNSVNATFQLIKCMSEFPQFEQDEEPKDAPDVGFHDSSGMQLCCV